MLPAATVDWSEGRFTGLRARGGFEVSAAWKGGRLTEVEIVSTLGGPCAVKAEGLEAISDKSGEPLATAKDEMTSVMTQPGQVLRLRFRENDVANQAYDM